MKYRGKTYTFDDVTLLPQFNNIESRTEPSLSSRLTTDITIKVPIVNSPMDSVIGLDMAERLWRQGTIPIFHKYMHDIVDVLKQFTGKAFISIGVRDKDIDNLSRNLERVDNVLGVVIDVAHGHSSLVLNTIKKIKDEFPNLQIIAGSVCTQQGYQDLAQAGANSVRVGIGPGSACITREVTGHGVPQFSAILHCAEIARKLGIPIIADGGIRSSSDIVKALAAGASTVMIGKLLAACEESSAKKRSIYPPQVEANYRGQASEAFQIDQCGGLKEGTVPEGESAWIPVTGTVDDLFKKLLGGIRSGMTYGGARSIKELQRKAEFVSVCGGFKLESGTRLK